MGNYKLLREKGSVLFLQKKRVTKEKKQFCGPVAVKS